MLSADLRQLLAETGADLRCDVERALELGHRGVDLVDHVAADCRVVLMSPLLE